MEWSLALILAVLVWCDCSEKINKLQKSVALLKKKQKGGCSQMSKIIMDLIGENCKIKMEETFAFTNIETVCTVLEADEEWIKIAYFDKKGNTKTKLVRIESIMHIELTGK